MPQDRGLAAASPVNNNNSELTLQVPALQNPCLWAQCINKLNETTCMQRPVCLKKMICFHQMLLPIHLKMKIDCIYEATTIPSDAEINRMGQIADNTSHL